MKTKKKIFLDRTARNDCRDRNPCRAASAGIEFGETEGKGDLLCQQPETVRSEYLPVFQ